MCIIVILYVKQFWKHYYEGNVKHGGSGACGYTFRRLWRGQRGVGQWAGHIDVAVGLNPDAVASGGGRGADAPSVTAADLALRLTADDGSYSGSWDSAEEFPSDKEFKAGQYTLEAFYGTEDDEGFGKPYYYGVQNFRLQMPALRMCR